MEPTSRNGRRFLNLRGLVTLLTAVAFSIMIVSGVMLYLAPRGRVANWTGWTLLGLGKEQWSGLHMTAAVLLLMVIGFHLYFNFRPLCHYVSSRVTRSGVRLRELAVAGVVGLVLVAGTVAGVWPFSTVVAMNEEIKDRWESTAGTIGRAPSTRTQETSVREFAARTGLSLDAMTEALKAHGIEVEDAEIPISALARQHGLSLQRIHEVAAGGEVRSGRRGLTEQSGMMSAASGTGQFGRLTLVEFCRAESVALSAAVQGLKAQGIEATQECRLRDLAGQMDMTPRELAEWLKTRI
jgi:hypothetical protein